MERRYRLAVVVAVAVSSHALWASEESQKTDEQAIRATAQLYIAAIERGDAKAALSYWAPGGDIIDTTQKKQTRRRSARRGSEAE